MDFLQDSAGALKQKLSDEPGCPLFPSTNKSFLSSLAWRLSKARHLLPPPRLPPPSRLLPAHGIAAYFVFWSSGQMSCASRVKQDEHCIQHEIVT